MTSIMWPFPGKQGVYDIKTFLEITKTTTNHLAETRSGRRAGQIASFLASLFSCDGARLVRCHVARPTLFRLL